MATMPSRQRPPLSTQDTMDQVRLAGRLDPDGTADLIAETPSTRGNGAISRPVRSKQDDATTHQPSLESSSDDSIEDYDALELDPDTLVANSRKSMDNGFRPSGVMLGDSHDGSKEKVRRRGSEPARDRGSKKRNSIHVRLERTDHKGRYTLTADDPDIREILRKGIEREEADAGKKKKTRLRFRDLVFTRQFSTFDSRNPSAAESPFFGFFTLFWIAMVLLFVQVSMRNWRDYGSILGTNQMMKMMFSHDVYVLGITDGVMFASTSVTFALQKVIQRGWLHWETGGWIMQNIWQSIYLGAVVEWAYFREWPWTHTIFAVLHGLVFLMKQHSYAFYNGYLSGVHRRRALLQKKLVQLQQMEPTVTPPTSPTSPNVSSRRTSSFASGTDAQHNKRRLSEGSPVQRRGSMGPRTNTNLLHEHSDVSSVARAIESGGDITVEQLSTFQDIVTIEISELTRELEGKCTDGHNAYPNNLHLSDFAQYICLPTLVYELDYPRQERINWWYVLEKTTATFGVLCVMMVISQAYIYPAVAKTVRMKESNMPIEQRWRELPFIVSDMLFPLLIEQLLTWYLIWECILNVLAELTRFADRGFYGDWWNSVTWDQYARDWNRPVHLFLLRHVYHSSISTFHLSRNAATFVTFLLSALVHEMCMAIMFKKVRGYLFWTQLLQMPLVAFSSSKMMKGRKVLGNVIFWMGLFVGPSVLTSLYLVI